jgi:hypothetical protein
LCRKLGQQVGIGLYFAGRIKRHCHSVGDFYTICVDKRT